MLVRRTLIWWSSLRVCEADSFDSYRHGSHYPIGRANLNIDEKQATQFVLKFGIGKDKLEGQVYGAIIGTVELLVTEIDKSIKFFQTRYPSTKLERIVVTAAVPFYLNSHCS